MQNGNKILMDSGMQMEVDCQQGGKKLMESGIILTLMDINWKR